MTARIAMPWCLNDDDDDDGNYNDNGGDDWIMVMVVMVTMMIMKMMIMMMMTTRTMIMIVVVMIMMMMMMMRMMTVMKMTTTMTMVMAIMMMMMVVVMMIIMAMMMMVTVMTRRISEWINSLSFHEPCSEHPPAFILASSMRNIHCPALATFVVCTRLITSLVLEPGILKYLMPSPALKPACKIREQICWATKQRLRVGLHFCYNESDPFHNKLWPGREAGLRSISMRRELRKKSDIESKTKSKPKYNIHRRCLLSRYPNNPLIAATLPFSSCVLASLWDGELIGIYVY